MESLAWPRDRRSPSLPSVGTPPNYELPRPFRHIRAAKPAFDKAVEIAALEAGIHGANVGYQAGVIVGAGGTGLGFGLMLFLVLIFRGKR